MLRSLGMNDSGDDSELLRRLHAMGERPVAPATARRVLTRAHGGSATWWHSTKLKVAAALEAGFAAGSMGLASAGTLPAAVQDVAHSALGKVGIDVPPGHDAMPVPGAAAPTPHTASTCGPTRTTRPPPSHRAASP